MKLEYTPKESIELLNLPIRLSNCCKRNNVKTIGDFKRVIDDGSIRYFKNLGKKGVQEAVEILKKIKIVVKDETYFPSRFGIKNIK